MSIWPGPALDTDATDDETLKLDVNDDNDEPEDLDQDPPVPPTPAPGPWFETAEFCLPGSHLLDMQNFLSNLTNFWVKKIMDAGNFIGSWTSFPMKYMMASLCTGTATGEMTHEGAVICMSEHCGFPTSTGISFMGEKEKFKIRWITDNSLYQKGTCLYDDITLIKEGKANCIPHGKACAFARTVRPKNLKAGFSCTSWSKANCSYAANKSGMLTNNQELASVRTFRATCDAIEEKCPDTFMLENVDSIGAEEDLSSNLNLVLDALRNVNAGMYHVIKKLVISSDFGLPQSRPEVCICNLT